MVYRSILCRFRHKREFDRALITLGAVYGGEDLHRFAPFFARHHGGAIFEDGSQKILDLQFVIILCRINCFEKVVVFLLPLREQILFVGQCPDIVDGRLGNGGHARNEHGAAIRLDAQTCAITAVDRDFAIQRGILRIAHHDVAQSAVLKTDNSKRRVIYFDVGMIHVSPAAV